MKRVKIILVMLMLTALSIATQAQFYVSTVNENLNGCGGLYGSIAVTAKGIFTPPCTYSDNGGVSYQGATLFSNLTVGTYTVQAKDHAGNISIASVVVIGTNAPANFTYNVVNATGQFIPNGDITVLGTGGSGFYNYSDNNGSTYQSSARFTGLLPNTYNVIIKDALGCISSPQQVTVGY